MKAEEIIREDPHVELISVEGGNKLNIRNKYTKRSLVISFQMVIDGHYQMIREDKATAERILQHMETQKKLTASNTLESVEGWGKTPTWIPRYPDLELLPTKLHLPREDGSIWGNISGTHTDPADKVMDTMITGFGKSGLELTNKTTRAGAIHMIFDNKGTIQNESQERRKVNCTIFKRGETTSLSFQYSYGM